MIINRRLLLSQFSSRTVLFILLALSPIATVSAEIVTWEAQGYVTYLDTDDGWITEFPNAVLGSDITLRVTFDTESPLSQTTTSSDGARYRYFGAVTGYELIINGDSMTRPLDTASQPFISVMDNYNVFSGNPAQDGLSAIAYAHSSTPGSFGQVGLVMRGPEYLSVFDGPGIPSDPSPLLLALSTHVIQFLDNSDGIVGEVTSLQRIIEGGGQTYELDLTLDLTQASVRDRYDGDGDLGQLLFLSSRSNFEPIALTSADTLRINFDFLGEQRLVLSSPTGLYSNGRETLYAWLQNSASSPGQVIVGYDISATFHDPEGQSVFGGGTIPTRSSSCNAPWVCISTFLGYDITDSSYSFSGVSYTISNLQIASGQGDLIYDQFNHFTAIAESIGIDTGVPTNPLYELYPLAGPGTTTTFSEGDGGIEFILYRSSSTFVETVYVSTLQNQGATNVGDYRAEWANEPVTFSAGQDRVQITIRDIDDSVYNEEDETFGLVVEDSPDGAILASSSFTIVDNDFFNLGVVKGNAVIAAISAFGAPYLGDGFTWGGKGWDEGGNYVDSLTLNSGYLYYDRAKYLRTERPYTSFGAGLDCSGLVRWAYNYPSDPSRKLGIIGDWSASNMANDSRVEFFTNQGDLEPGDLVFFNSGGTTRATHVALYIGPQFVFSDTCGVNGDAPCDLIEAYCANINSFGNCASGDPENTVRVTNLQRRMQTNLAGGPSNHFGFGRIYESTSTGIQIRTGSPVDLVVTDPDGVVITPLTAHETPEELIRGVPGELYYSIYDRDADGTPKSMVWSHKVKGGDYRIRVIPHADAATGSTFTLDVVTDQGTVLLANDVSVEDIPDEGYGVTIGAAEVSVFEPTNSPVTVDAGPSQVAECSSSDGAVVLLDASASTDPDGDTLAFHWKGPFGDLYGRTVEATIPLGTHHVVLTVDDGNGGANSTVLEVLVQDTTAPTVDVQMSPGVLWPPNHKLVPIEAIVTATDACDESPSVELASITTSEGDETNTYDPSYDSIMVDGNTSNDIVVDDEGNISLRAERSGNGLGRIYTLKYSATDVSGNLSSGEGQVTVPHNR